MTGLFIFLMLGAVVVGFILYKNKIIRVEVAEELEHLKDSAFDKIGEARKRWEEEGGKIEPTSPVPDAQATPLAKTSVEPPKEPEKAVSVDSNVGHPEPKAPPSEQIRSSPIPKSESKELLVSYSDINSFKKDLNGFIYGVYLDGRSIHSGFGPSDQFYTQADGSISRIKPDKKEDEVELKIEED